MPEPDLRLLQRGDPAAWEEAFEWLWPVASAVVQAKMGLHLPGDVEDVAMEALEELVDSVGRLGSAGELKSLVAAIAHNRAVSRLRAHFAKKRGGGATVAIEGVSGDGEGVRDLPDLGAGPLDQVGAAELASLLSTLREELKPEQRQILVDFFMSGLRYEEIAARHGLAVGSVGVYLKRGLDALRQAAGRQPGLLKELEANWR